MLEPENTPKERVIRAGDWFTRHRPFIIGGLILLILIYNCSGEDKPAPPPANVSQYAASPQPVAAAPWPEATEAVGLHGLMTTEQKQYYWGAYNQMMDSGANNKAVHYGNKVLSLDLITGQPYVTDKSVLCRAYHEKLALADKELTSNGLACRQEEGSWCRQPDGEKMFCRPRRATGIKGVVQDSEIGIDSVKTGINRTLNNWGLN